MATITMTFANTLNVSIQVVDSITTGSTANNDVCYYQSDGTTTITEIGPCIDIDQTLNTVTCDIDPGMTLPSVGDFIFFSKENIFNTSGIIGYFAEVLIEVTSTEQKELFAVSSEAFISS